MSIKLYHGSRHPDLLNELRPSDWEQTKNGITGKWLFSTHREDQAYLYACPFPKGGSFLTTLGDHTDILYLFRADRINEITYGNFNGKVYSFPADGFQQVIDSPREWVSPSSVMLEGSDVAVETVTNLDQVLEKGVQIFCLSENVPSDSLDAKSPNNIFENGRSYQKLYELLTQPQPPIIWLNEIRGVGRDPKLVSFLLEASATASPPVHCNYVKKRHDPPVP
jgi:hypothetical protein